MSPSQSASRFGAFAGLALAIAALGPSATRAHDPSIGFHVRASYPVPNFSQPGTFIRGPVIYNLPDPATSDSIYAGPADSSLDVFVDVNHGTEMASGFGVIMSLDGGGQVTFNPPPIDLKDPNPPNNISHALRQDFPRNTSFDLLFANTDVDGFPPGRVSVGVIGANDGGDTPVSDTEGIFAMPIRAQGGVTGRFEASFLLDAQYTGFVSFTGHVFSNDPTRSGTIEVRASIPGDMNGDGAANAGDVSGFLSALSDRSGFITQFPWLQTDYVADFNEDHEITLADVPLFEAACGCDTGLEPMPGDLNGDGVVDRNDVSQFMAVYGATNGQGGAEAASMTADFDDDGHIGATDLVILQSQINQSTPLPSPTAAASPAAVPEPAPVALALMAATILIIQRQRRR
jgi:hypothetical protein